MGNIQFEDSTEEFGPPPTQSSGGANDLTGTLVKWGLAANRAQAQSVMVGIIIAVWVVIGLIFFLWL